MKKQIKVLMIGAGLCAASMAQAESLDIPGFSLGYDAWLQPVIVSQDHGTTQILLTGLWDEMFPISTTSGSSPNANYTDALVAGTVRNGYRIESLTLSATLVGTMGYAPLPDGCASDPIDYLCSAGHVNNTTLLGLTATPNGGAPVEASLTKSNVNGTESAAVKMTEKLVGNFSLGLKAYYSTFAESGYVYYHIPGQDWDNYRTLDTSASIGFSGPLLLTVQVAAVPEPGTYAMLLAGLGLLGAVVRKRRQ